MPAGRPTKYTLKEKDLEMVTNYCLLGCIDEQLAEFLSISVATLNNWKNEHPKFLESIKKGKEDADALVVKSLFKKANGYKYKEKTFEILVDPVSGKAITDKPILKQIKEKEQHADTGAIAFWLKNRRHKEWNKRDNDNSSENKVVRFTAVPIKEEDQ